MGDIKKILCITLLTFFISSDTMGTSYCTQKFVIHGKTEGSRGLLFFDVITDGACERTESYILSLEPTKTNIWLNKSGYSGTNSLLETLSDLNFEKKVSLNDSDGYYSLNDSSSFALPLYDSTFKSKFYRLCNEGSCDAKHWNSACPVNCKDIPQFKGVEADLIYTYQGGIYKNYTFTDVLYFPKSNYLIVVTYQPLEAVGGDTNHGMLIFYLH